MNKLVRARWRKIGEPLNCSQAFWMSAMARFALSCERAAMKTLAFLKQDLGDLLVDARVGASDDVDLSTQVGHVVLGEGADMGGYICVKKLDHGSLGGLGGRRAGVLRAMLQARWSDWKARKQQQQYHYKYRRLSPRL